MVSSRWLFFLSAFFMLTALAVAQLPPAYFPYQLLPFPYCFNDKGNYTANSPYETNLKQLLSSNLLASDIGSNSGFYNSSYGQNSDQVHAIGLCRGDINLDVCLDCLNSAKTLLLQRCPNQKEAIIWYNYYCMFRYSNRSIHGVMEFSPPVYVLNPQNESANYVVQFNNDLRKLLENLINQAKDGDSLRKFAANNASAPDFQALYALVQCTPDLSMDDCEICLRGTTENIPQCCDGRMGGLITRPSCNIRFDTYSFFNSTTQDSSAPPVNNTPTTGNMGNSMCRTITIIAVSIAASVILLITICIRIRVRRWPWVKPESESVDKIESVESMQLDFDTIKVATDNFSQENKLGQGGFGVVYKGRLPNGQAIAVKRLSRDSDQGDSEFKNEVLLVAKLQHRNLVRLQGFCLQRNERLLVYEFVPNTSLDHFLFDPIRRRQLDWERRYKIIGGIARGMHYLHEDSQLRIIHRDLKASNILLDEEMNPKISDFGMARLFSIDQSQANTSRIVGTYGYMAPEYAMHGNFSVKSDVFSYSVLVLEMVCGWKNTCFQNGENTETLLSHAWKNWREGTTSNLVGSMLRVGSTTEIMRCIHIGLLCVQENVAERPTMASVLLMLNNYTMALSIPSRPAFLMDNTVESDMSSDPSFQASQNEVSISEPYPR